MAATIVIPGLTADDKVPGFYGETKYGGGRLSVSSMPSRCLLLGPKLSDGTAVADQDIDQILDEDRASELYGARSLLANMAFSAFEADGVDLWCAPVAEAGSAAQATLVITIGGSWTAPGRIGVRLGGKPYVVGVAVDDEITDLASRLTSKINEDSKGLWLAEAAGTTPWAITCTMQSAGAEGNLSYGAVDLNGSPAGLTMTLAGGTAVTGGITPFSGGSGVSDIQNVLDLISVDEFDIIASAYNDATNAAALASHVNSEAAATINHLEHFVLGSNDLQATAVSLAQTTLNEYRGCLLHSLYNEAHPALWASEFAARRSVLEQTHPNQLYDDMELTTAAPQAMADDRPLHTEQKAALNSGVTPLNTVNGKVRIVRAITTHSLSGSSADYRTLDLADAVVPDRVRRELELSYKTWRQANPFVRDDLAEEDDPPPAGTGTPSLWNSLVVKFLLDVEQENWVQDVRANLPVSTFDHDAKRIMSAVPVIAALQNHQIGVSVRQQVAS